METDKAIYVFKHYGHLMTERERMANRHLIGTAKATSGRSDVAAQREVIHRAPPLQPGELCEEFYSRKLTPFREYLLHFLLHRLDHVTNPKRTA